MADWSPQANSLFMNARELAAGQERDAYLDKACGGDQVLRSKVLALLDASEVAGSFLEPTPADLPTGSFYSSTHLERPGDKIGPYRLQQAIGEGGMGLVYMAEQTEPVRRTVAIKLLKPDMDGRQVIARFEAERQALALMDHPNIAKVLEVGTTATGRPYFVMELVKGMPITRYCDDRRLTLHERLGLFIPVCQAVQHAHQKGIIHRDLKPSNVLVALYDGRPVPKVIDFGVAKATGQKLTDRTLFTEFGAVIGTLEYMSPEQAELNQLDIDTRSDVYSLGVLLYELLTGSTPLERKRFKDAAFLELLRLIREEEPPKPSTRLSATEELPTIAANRSAEPRKLGGVMRGDLDWVVMKALEKDRNRRYETPSALAADIGSYLADQPVAACRPSVSYRLRKFVRRNRGVVTAAMVILAILAGGVAASIWQAVRATRAEHAALEERDAKEKARRDALVAANQARRAAAEERKARDAEASQRQRAERVSDLMVAALASPDPDRDGRTITIAEVLDRAASSVEKQLADDPATLTRMLLTIAHSYSGLGLYQEEYAICQKVLALRQKSLGDDNLETLEAMYYLARSAEHMGRSDEAIELAEKALTLRQEKLGPNHFDVLRSMNLLGGLYSQTNRIEESIKLLEVTLAGKKALLGDSDPDTLNTMSNLASSYHGAHRLDDAIKLQEQILKLETDMYGVGKALIDSGYALAVSYYTAGRYDEALELAQRVLERVSDYSGGDHPRSLMTLRFTGQCLAALGRPQEALIRLEETLPRTTARLGAAHKDTLSLMIQLADVYAVVGRYTEAAKLHRQLLERTTNPKQRGRAMAALGGNLLRLRETDEGVRILTEAFHERIDHCVGNDAEALRAAWPGLADARPRPEDRPGQAGLDLDGMDDYVVLPGVQFDGFPPWTIEVIVKPQAIEQTDDWTSLISATDVGSMGLETSGGKWSFSMHTSEGYSNQWQDNYSSAVADDSIPLNEWQHVAAVWDGKDMRIYVNGQLQRHHVAASRCTKLSAEPFFLGADPYYEYAGRIAQGYLDGQLRAARISRAVEYTDSFASPERLDKTPQTIGLYDFTIDTGRYAIDLSGHGHHGIIVGARFVQEAE